MSAANLGVVDAGRRRIVLPGIMLNARAAKCAAPNPLHSNSGLSAHLGVVDVGRRHVVLPGLVPARAAKGAVVAADGGLVPGQPPAKLVPAPLLVLQRAPTGGRNSRRHQEGAKLCQPE